MRDSLKRVYFHYEELEEYHAGMWRIVRGPERVQYAEAAADLLRDPDRFREVLEVVLMVWPKSCAAALSADASNRIAWLGWAACCLDSEVPQDCTRQGWHELTQRQKDEANRVAAMALAKWESQHIEAEEVVYDLFAWGQSA